MGQKEEKFSTLRARHFGRRIVEAFGKLLTISFGTSEDSLGTVISFRWPQCDQFPLATICPRAECPRAEPEKY